MFLYGLAFLVFLAGLGVILVAWLSAHRTILPAIRGAAYLWWPGLGLWVLAALMLTVPSVLAYQQCQVACDVLDGRPTDQAFAARVAKDYENCVRSGVAEARRNAAESIKNGATGVDIEAAAAAAEPGLREVCSGMVTSQCVAVCYRPHETEIVER